MNTPRLARHLLIVIALGLVVFLAVRIYLMQPESPLPEDAPTASSSGSDLELSDVTFTETEAGEALWTLKADKANYTKSAQFADFKGVEVVFYGPGKTRRAFLRAHSAEADLTTHEIVARGQVRLEMAEGGQLQSESLYYRHDEATLWTDKMVRFEHLGARIDGQGMTYTLEEKLLHLESDVSAYVPFSSR